MSLPGPVNISRTLVLIYIKIKKTVALLGHNVSLKIYVDPQKNYVEPGM